VAKQCLNLSQNFIATALRDRSSVTGIASFPRELLGYLLNADKQHGQSGVSLRDFGAGLESVHDRHGKIHNNDVGLELLDSFNRLNTSSA
jgi:hypothetical protein